LAEYLLGLMLLVIDRDNCLSIYGSLPDAAAHLETIDVEDGEYQFCDEHGQPYVGEVLKPVEKFSGGEFRIVPYGAPDARLPAAFVARASHYDSGVLGLKTLADARARFCHE
jgi:hypothetical protein